MIHPILQKKLENNSFFQELVSLVHFHKNDKGTNFLVYFSDYSNHINNTHIRLVADIVLNNTEDLKARESEYFMPSPELNEFIELLNSDVNKSFFFNRATAGPMAPDIDQEYPSSIIPSRPSVYYNAQKLTEFLKTKIPTEIFDNTVLKIEKEWLLQEIAGQTNQRVKTVLKQNKI